jgi:Uri superfamily endonuclease
MKGIYTIVMVLKRDVTLKVGKLGMLRFSRGVYAYSGSARGKGPTSIQGRMRRHMGRRHRKLWHIDYLLSADCCEIKAIIYSETMRDLECEANRRIRELACATFPVKGFGSSDCACISHLLYFPSHRTNQALAIVQNAHVKLHLRPRLCRPARSV